MQVETFRRQVEERGIMINDGQMEQFEKYFQLLVEWNEKINLTAITDKEEVYEKHFFDSIAASFFFDFSKVETLIDIGAGAGFPSLPIKILFPHLKVTIIDSLRKRITFLELLMDHLGLSDVTCLHGRAEDFGVMTEYREQFDLATARAVARLNVLAEYCVPFVRIGGYFLALKGADGRQELKEANKSIQSLGAKEFQVDTLHLPADEAERTIIQLQKKSSTPKKYPRKAGTPAKKPIL
jgi:16S rRNA (guanine527-N7)-methyltransferase